jgi:hypothetical protein
LKGASTKNDERGWKAIYDTNGILANPKPLIVPAKAKQ